jgi:hypothetical protein
MAGSRSITSASQASGSWPARLAHSISVSIVKSQIDAVHDYQMVIG